jgi:ribose transport system ATP-binding protein
MAAGISYVPEDRHRDAAFEHLSVADNLSITTVSNYWRGGFMRTHSETRDATTLCTEFLIRCESPQAPFTSLSGGNQQKVILARWLRRSPNILLLDEPTQGVDVGARADIYELIQKTVEKGAGALVASSDFEELASICDRIVVLHRGMTPSELVEGNISADEITRAANLEVAA